MISTISQEDTHAISLLLDQFTDAWNAKQVEEMAALFTEAAEFIDIMGQIALGKKQIAQMHQQVFQGPMKKAQLSCEILYLRTIAAHKVIATCKWMTQGHTVGQAHSMPARRGILVMIFSLVDEVWSISLVQNFDFTKLYNNVEDYEMNFLAKA